MKKQGFIVATLALASLGIASSLQAQDAVQESPATAEQGAADQAATPSGQPIAFPHDVHAGTNQIECQYCHFAAERSMRAGIPPVQTCMGCHNFVAGSENPEEVALLRGYWDRQEPIPWNRIYKVSDHVQFPHMRHISAGVDCQTCHGPVQELGVIQEVNQPLAMGWCVGCHIEREASRDCTVCHY